MYLSYLRILAALPRPVRYLLVLPPELLTRQERRVALPVLSALAQFLVSREAELRRGLRAAGLTR